MRRARVALPRCPTMAHHLSPRRLGTQGPELDPIDGGSALEVRYEVQDRRGGCEGFGPHGQHEQGVPRPHVVGKEREQLEAGGIEPLEVVDGEQRGSRGCDALRRPEQRLEEPEALESSIAGWGRQRGSTIGMPRRRARA